MEYLGTPTARSALGEVGRNRRGGSDSRGICRIRQHLLRLAHDGWLWHLGLSAAKPLGAMNALGPEQSDRARCWVSDIIFCFLAKLPDRSLIIDNL